MLELSEPMRAVSDMAFHRTGMQMYVQDCIDESERDPHLVPKHVPIKRS